MRTRDKSNKDRDRECTTAQEDVDRGARIAALKQAIECGEYDVSTTALSNCLLRRMLQTK